MKNKTWISRGDLAYLPADVCLLQFDERGHPSKYFKTKKPQSVLVHPSDGQPSSQSQGRLMYRVVFKGESWFVETPNLYPIAE